MPRFGTVVLDVDSTLTGIEGIDWLAARRGMAVATEIAELTSQAMNGEVPIEALYGLRLDLVKPGADEVAALAEAYVREVAPGAREALADFRAAGVEVHLVSGGLRQAIVPFAGWLGVPPGRVHAVGIIFDAGGRFADWERASPLATAQGKGVVLGGLTTVPPVLMVGDGITDLSARTAGAAIAAFTGFVRRDAVVRAADHILGSYAELRTLVLP